MQYGLHWRAMTTLDLPAVEAIAREVHPAFPEDIAIFVERQRLYPDGARFLEFRGRPSGYVLSHPWMSGALPALNHLLGALPEHADTFYLHDLALLPQARGSGAADIAVDQLLDHALRQGFGTASLIAVNGSTRFWSRHGFAEAAADGLGAKLMSYEPSARLMVRRLNLPGETS
jgi:GNAT superfamily N-acetyltransferase